MERIADLDELILRCRTEQAKEYIAEAVVCYRAGAYRASIVTTWIAVVYDLLDKGRELSLSGDAKASAFIKDFESIQDAHRRNDPDALKRSLEFERSILDRMRDEFEMLTPVEHMDLTRLKDDRNRCAHPTVNQPDEAYRPTAELARLHLRNAITHVLQQPPMQSKAALDILKREVYSNYFPSTPAQAIVQLKNGPLAKAKDNLAKEFVGWLVSSYFKKPSEAPRREALAATIVAAWQMYPAVGSTTLKKRLGAEIAALEDRRLGVGVLFVAHVPGTWDMLAEAHQDKLRASVLTGSEFGLSQVIAGAEKLEDLRDAAQTRIAKLNTEQMTLLVAHTQSNAVIQRALQLLADSGSFYRSIEIIDKIIIPLLVVLRRPHVEEIIRIASQNIEVRGSFGFSKLLQQLREAEIVKPDELNKMLRDHELVQDEDDGDSEPSDELEESEDEDES